LETALDFAELFTQAARQGVGLAHRKGLSVLFDYTGPPVQLRLDRTQVARSLDQVFRALSDATRRDVVHRLGQAPASVSELAAPYGMSLPGFMKHLRVLEEAGLVVRNKEGRTVHCELAPHALGDAAMWLAGYERFWNARLDALGRFLYHQEEVDPWQKAPSSKPPNSGSRASIPSPRRKSGAPGPSRKR
jgi:DNA-binding transcriptional ArsR family regulator